MQLYLQLHYKGKSQLFGSIVSLTSKVSDPKYLCQNKGVDGVWTHDLRFTRPTPYHLATTPCICLLFCQLQISWKVLSIGNRFIQKYSFRNERYFPQDQGMDGTRTHDLWFTRPTPCHLATTPLNSVFSSFLSPIFQWCRGEKMGISIRCSLEDHNTYTSLVCHTRHVLENDKNRLWWDSNPQPLNISIYMPRSPMRYPLRHRAYTSMFTVGGASIYWNPKVRNWEVAFHMTYIITTTKALPTRHCWESNPGSPVY